MSAPYMPLYIPDLFADTMHLTCFERGAYIQLLCHMWRAGGKLPADDARLSKLLQLSVNDWVNIKDEILPFFIKRGNSISQKRLSKEIVKYDNKIVKAKTAAKSRWSEKDNKNNANSDFQALPMQCQQEQEQEQVIDKSIIEKNITKKEKPTRKKSTQIDPDWQPNERNIQDALQLGLTNEDIENEARKFKNRQIAKGATYVNWDAAWQNWCDSPYCQSNPKNAGKASFATSQANKPRAIDRTSIAVRLCAESAERHRAGRA